MAKAKTEPESTEPTEPAKRPAPPVVVGPACMPRPQERDQHRTLEVMCHDLGFYHGRITGHYGNELRNAVSELQQQLIANSEYTGIPDGVFSEATRAALLASSIPTIIED